MPYKPDLKPRQESQQGETRSAERLFSDSRGLHPSDRAEQTQEQAQNRLSTDSLSNEAVRELAAAEAQEALRRYQEEGNPRRQPNASASPLQPPQNVSLPPGARGPIPQISQSKTRSGPPPIQPPVLRHRQGSISSRPAAPLQKIPEVLQESDSSRPARPNSLTTNQVAESNNRNSFPQQQQQRTPHHTGRRTVSGDYTRTLPRNYDPIIGAKRTYAANNDGRAASRPSLPYLFSSSSPSQPDSTPTIDLPNPQSASYRAQRDSELSTAQLQRRASESSGNPLIRSASSSQWPTPPPRQQQYRNSAVTTQAHMEPQRFQQQQASTSAAVAASAAKLTAQFQSESQPSPSSTWSETDSTPTPTASSVAAQRERNAQLEKELIPVRLINPTSFLVRTNPMQPTPADLQSAVADRVTSLDPQTVFLKAAAMPFAPARPSNLSAPPIRSNSNDTSYSGETVALLPDGTPVPTLRTDFQNLKRISLPKSANVITPSASSNERPKVAETDPLVTPQSPTQTQPPRITIQSPPPPSKPRDPQRPNQVPPSLQPALGSSSSRNNTTAVVDTASTGIASRNSPSHLKSVGGHVLGTTNVAILPRRDGSVRAIYSPTPKTLAAARRESTLLVPGQREQSLGSMNHEEGDNGERGESADQRSEDLGIPSPLSGTATAPTAPQLPSSLKFTKSEPSLGSERLPEFDIVPAPSQGQASSTFNDQLQTKSDETGVKKRDEMVGYRDDPRRNTFGEITSPSTDILEEAKKKLFLYQQEQEQEQRQGRLHDASGSKDKNESKEGAVATDNQERSRSRMTAESKTRSALESVPISAAAARRESAASVMSRRDSIGSATTALDSPTRDEFLSGSSDTAGHVATSSGVNLGRRAGGDSLAPTTASASLGRRGPTPNVRAIVAPPSDVPEVQEPSDEEQSRLVDEHEQSKSRESDETEYDPDTKRFEPMTIDTYPKQRRQKLASYENELEKPILYDDRNDNFGGFDQEGGQEFRFIPIVPSSVKLGKKKRPGTKDTRVSFVSNPSQAFFGNNKNTADGRTRRHGSVPACRACFRAGFDCAMNLQLGEGTVARKAFQDFVNAGGLNAFSIRNDDAIGRIDAGDGSIYDDDRKYGPGQGSITIEQALGRNYVDKLGEVAFGESALSRPVTRGMYNELMEEKQEREMRRLLSSEHKPWNADDGTHPHMTEHDIQDGHYDDAKGVIESEKVGDSIKPKQRNLGSNKDHRLSQMTLHDHDADQGQDSKNIDPNSQRGILLNNIDGYDRRRDGWNFDIDPADYESFHEDGDNDDEDGSDEDEDDDDSDIVTWADRWTRARKSSHMVVYLLAIFSLQALGSGYTNTVFRMMESFEPALNRQEALLLQIGSLAFNASQGGGLLWGNGIVGFSRQRVTLLVLTAISITSVVAGFVRSVAAILAGQSLLGIWSGMIIFLALSTIMDLFSSLGGRLLGIVSILLVLSTGQVSGPWISKLILSLVFDWSWTYWMLLIGTVVFTVYVGIANKESAAFILFRREALRLKRIRLKDRTAENQSGDANDAVLWTPEPQSVTTPRQVFQQDLLRPFRLLGSGWVVPALTLAFTLSAATFVYIFSGLQTVFVSAHRMSATKASIAVTVSCVIGIFLGLVTATVVNSRSSSTKGIRPLYIDEKGFIDTFKPGPQTESLLGTALIGSALFSFSLYTLAISSSFATTWFLTCMGIILLVGALMLIAASLLQYILEAFSPSRKTRLRDVVAREDPATPASTLVQGETGRSRAESLHGGAHRDGDRYTFPWSRRMRADASTSQSVPTLQTDSDPITQRDKRWLDETALAALTAMVSLSFTAASAMSVVAGFGYAKLSFASWAVILASASIAVGILILIIYAYGAKSRVQSLKTLDLKDSQRDFRHRSARKRRRSRMCRRRRSHTQRDLTDSRHMSLPEQPEERQRRSFSELLNKVANALAITPYAQIRPEMRRVEHEDTREVVRQRSPSPARTTHAEGRRELWLAKLVASRQNASRWDHNGRPGPDADADAEQRLLRGTEERTDGHHRRSTPPAGDGTRDPIQFDLAQGQTTNPFRVAPTANAPVSRQAEGQGQTDYRFESRPKQQTYPPGELEVSGDGGGRKKSDPAHHPLPPPPRTRMRGKSISEQRNPAPDQDFAQYPLHPQPKAAIDHTQGFEILNTHPNTDNTGNPHRPTTPVTTRKSADLTHLTNRASPSPNNNPTSPNFNTGYTKQDPITPPPVAAPAKVLPQTKFHGHTRMHSENGTRFGLIF